MQQYLSTLQQVVQDGLDKNLIHYSTQSEILDGRVMSINSKELINFGSCSYLGIEQHLSLKEACSQAANKYGTQFSSSRTYVSLGLYEELENLLYQIFEKPTVVTASTTLGHLSVLPVIIEDNDAVILDFQVHSSVQMAAQLLKARNIPIHIIPHNDINRLESKIEKLKARHNKIWYLTDGVFSMYGDFAPMEKLEELLNRHKQFHLYIDDAHGMSWVGKNGCGYVRSCVEHHPKMIIAISLNKAFASAGGAVVFPDAEMASKVRNCGGTLIFSGPIQPPMLGVACASAKLHLSEEIYQYQRHLADLINHTNQLLNDYGLPQFRETSGPLFFIPVGLPRIIYNIIKRLLGDGFYTNAASFPATPMRKGGLRFLINGNIKRDDISQMVECLAKHYPEALAEEKSSCEEVAQIFGLSDFSSKLSIPKSPHSSTFNIEFKTSLEDINADEWDNLFAARGNLSYESLAILEKNFNCEQRDLENQWRFFYFIVRENSRIVLATFFTCAYMKEDMFASKEVSKEIEKSRHNDPYFLTAKYIMLGTPITKGNHLYLDYDSSSWDQALEELISKMREIAHSENASQILLRDFPRKNSHNFKQKMLDLGFIEYHLPNLCTIDDLSWKSNDEYLSRLGQKFRYNVRREILAYQENFKCYVAKNMSQQEIENCYQLYSQVYEKAYELNVFKLPLSFFQDICQHPDYDIIRMYLQPSNTSIKEEKLVAVMYSFVKSNVYSALIVGLDYQYLYSHKIYKQILYQTVQRASELGCTSLDLAYTAELEKKKVGAKTKPMCAYVEIFDHYNQTLIQSMTAKVGE
ncbi:aminotransferase class I/II-fold pyridoxal phosphate-dependent enzyme [Candidatus Uabimicrobium sp. HlEnr_7]|uniref:aminotransferase class I/II-fold pyridoxal phosphate-dependent enzyme n=1 Tax=Candidatus Uabimicrobium helgolandensis TaxID=3095367 RepID=UPI0035583F88